MLVVEPLKEGGGGGIMRKNPLYFDKSPSLNLPYKLFIDIYVYILTKEVNANFLEIKAKKMSA